MLHKPRAKGPRGAPLLVQLAYLFVTDVAASAVLISGLCDGCLALALASLGHFAVVLATLWVVRSHGRRGRQH